MKESNYGRGCLNLIIITIVLILIVNFCTREENTEPSQIEFSQDGRWDRDTLRYHHWYE